MHPFPVKVNRDTAGELKDLVKEKQSTSFKDIDTNQLKLWKWNQPGDADMVKDLDLDSRNALNPMKKIISILELILLTRTTTSILSSRFLSLVSDSDFVFFATTI